MKIHDFFRLCLPVHPSIHHPSVNTSWRGRLEPRRAYGENNHISGIKLQIKKICKIFFSFQLSRLSFLSFLLSFLRLFYFFFLLSYIFFLFFLFSLFSFAFFFYFLFFRSFFFLLFLQRTCKTTHF